MKKVLYLMVGFFMAIATTAKGEDGSNLWLRFDEQQNNNVTGVACIALDELRQHWKGGAVVLKRQKKMSKDSYTISARGGKTVIEGADNTALLYGAFHLLRLQQMGEDVGDLSISEKPTYPLRILNHWDNPNGTVERGFAGRSIFLNPTPERMKIYARANASIGINGTVLNNVNAKPEALSTENLQKVKRYGPIEALKRGRIIDCYILAPQNPGGSWQPSKVMKLVEWAEQHFNVDSNRIYCIGMSLGGYGTMDFCATYPDRVAAGMALCGGATVKDVTGLSRMPMWIVHGTADRAVPVSASDKVVEAVRKTGDDSRLIYTRMPGIDHGRPARIFYLPQTYDWLFSHSLEDEGRPVNRDFEITPQILQSAYQDIGKYPEYDD